MSIYGRSPSNGDLLVPPGRHSDSTRQTYLCANKYVSTLLFSLPENGGHVPGECWQVKEEVFRVASRGGVGGGGPPGGRSNQG